MPITLNGTTGIIGPDGSAAAPAIQGSDNNTGMFFPAADTVAIATGGSERARVDSSGNVAVGTTTTSNGRLSVYGPGGATANSLFLTNVDGTYNPYLQVQHSLNGTNLFASSSFGGNASTLNFTTPGGSMRFDGGGNLLVNATATTGNVEKMTLQYAANTNNGFYIKNTFAGTGNNIGFVNSSNTVVGTIQSTPTATSYNTNSDYRLKEDVQPMVGALAKVAALKPVTYKWKSDGSAGEGFIAHELQAVVPDCVTGAKDAVDAEGQPVYQGIDTSFLVATLTAAIQEQQALITSLTTRIAALEGAAQ